MRLFISSFLFLFFIFGSHALFSIPLKKTQSPDPQKFKTYVQNFQSYNKGEQYLQDYTYVYYLGQVGFGTPEQKLSVLVDTGLPAVWFSAAKFDVTKSTTYVNAPDCKVSRPFTAGRFEALNKKDNLNLGGAKIQAQSFELVTEGINGLPFDGILGLAYPSAHPRCGPEVTPVQNLVAQNVAPGIFSLRYNKDKSSEDVGEVVFGGIDSNYVDASTLDYIPVTQKPFWQIAVEGVKISSGQTVCQGGCQAAIDSSSPVIAGPSADVKQLYASITGGVKYSNGTYEINCQDIDKFPSLTFTINGKEYTLKGEDYILQFGTTCISSLVSEDFPDYAWLLGDSFIRNFYTVFDQEKDRVAFGRLK